MSIDWVIIGDCRLACGDVLAVLRELPERSVQCCVTSPPYWGLRDYGVDGQIGLEPTPELYVAKMVKVFAEVWRVLRDDGTLWLNLGDSYTSGGRYTYGTFTPESKQASHPAIKSSRRPGQPENLKPKDLCGIPWRVALALQADGWTLRSDIIWHKPNPMPESVTDRPTKAHEYIFLMSKSARYYYDAEAIREPQSAGTHERFGKNNVASSRRKMVESGSGIKNNASFDAAMKVMIQPDSCRNKRSVWKIGTFSYPEAHFATFPPKLVEPCIKAGTSERGCCPTCGTPWRRITTKRREATRPGTNSKVNRASDDPESPYHQHTGSIVGNRDPQRHVTITQTAGWGPGCECGGGPIPCTVLDPFNGSGTTGEVCTKLGRKYIGIELNPDYIELSKRRIGKAAEQYALFQSPAGLDGR